MSVRTGRKKEYRLPGLLALGTALLIMLLFPALLQPADPAEADPTTAAPTLAENPYGPEDFGYDGEYLTCLGGESVLGIDVSSHQQDIDWEAVADAGVEFVMIRLGYRGYETGVIHADVNAQQNYEGAKAAGLRVGAYFFSQATTTEEAVEEAVFALNMIEDWEVDMPVVYDWEYVSEDARTAQVDRRTLTDCTIAFCQRVENAGHTPMVYFNVSQVQHRLYLEELTDYQFWLAMYTEEMDFAYQVDMWQYTCEGTVPGIETDVDINLWLTYEE